MGNPDDLPWRANRVRDIPLPIVLRCRGARRDPHDRAKWLTEQGPISVADQKFMNWLLGTGGRGAIDLVMHLAQVDCRTAIAWLEQQLMAGPMASFHLTRMQSGKRSSAREQRPRPLSLPVPEARMLGRIRQYLTDRRHLQPALLEPLIASGRLYADHRGNAVFLLVAGKENRPVGAELRGTRSRSWRGMAPGTCKDLGYFWVGTRGSHQIVLCESAIDAISCFQMDRDRICISTSGVRSDPRWLPGLIARGYDIRCGFDADVAGDLAARRMTALFPSVQRLRPPAHDWNDALAAP